MNKTVLKNWSEYLEESGIKLYRDVRVTPAGQTIAERESGPAESSTVASEPSSPAPAKETTTPTPPAASTGPEPQTPVDQVEPETLEQIRADMGDCQRCKLGKTRTHLVFGEGNPQARLMFVGEGPGADEDRTGRPFVGKAGKLLTKMIEAMGLAREDVYIANIIKSRPPNNRDPEPDEIAACFPFLQRQIRVIQPEVIVTLGKPSARTLLGQTEPISQYRGKWHQFDAIPVMPTWHPAYLLRNEREKRSAWEDLQAVMEKLNLGKSA